MSHLLKTYPASGCATLCFAMGLLTLAPVSSPAADPPQMEYPKIQGHGGVFPAPQGAEGPQKGSKVVVDVTSGAMDGGVNKGLARAARFVNLLTIGGDTEPEVAVVLHGGATKAALSSEAHSKHIGEANPNLEAMKKLREAGVEILVCSQALRHLGYSPDETDKNVDVALSAATAIINRQMQGFAYLPIP